MENNMNSLVPVTEKSVTVNVDDAIQEWKNYQRLCNELLDESDFQVYKRKENGVLVERKFKKKSAWQKLGRAFNVATEIINKEIIRNKLNVIMEAEYTVRATLPNGRSVIAEGTCDRHESGKSNVNSHTIKSIAETRAVNRAISLVIGAGEVSDEELDPNFLIENEESVNTIDAEFSTANEVEPIQDDPVSKNWVRSFCKILKGQGKPCRKGVLIRCAKSCDKLSSEEKEQVILYIKSLPNGEIDLDD